MHHVHRFVLAAKVGYAILIPALITALAALAAPIAVAADAPSLKRGDEFIVFRDTRVELPGGKSRMLSRGTRAGDRSPRTAGRRHRRRCEVARGDR